MSQNYCPQSSSQHDNHTQLSLKPQPLHLIQKTPPLQQSHYYPTLNRRVYINMLDKQMSNSSAYTHSQGDKQSKDSDQNLTGSNSSAPSSKSWASTNQHVKIEVEITHFVAKPSILIEVSDQLSIYHQKRNFVIRWVKNNSEVFKLTRLSQALAMYYCDAYYQMVSFEPNRARSTLAVILTIASKQIDCKILYSQQMADCFNIPYRQFLALEKQVCTTLDYQLHVMTHAGAVSYMVHKLYEQTAYSLFEESQYKYLKLRKLYWLAELIYHAHFQLTKLALLLCFKNVLQPELQSVYQLRQFLQNFENKLLSDLKPTQSQQVKLQQLLSNSQQLWSTEQQRIRQNYRTRQQTKNYSYEEFQCRYFA